MNLSAVQNLNPGTPLARLRSAFLRDLMLPETGPAPSAPQQARALVATREAAAISQRSLARQVENKRVLITGGSSGIGLETARRVAAAGAKTIICGRDHQRLAEAKRQITDAGGQIWAHSVDLAHLTDCDAFVQQLLELHGGVDILINNAGRSIRRSVQHSLDRFHDFQRTMQLNYFGALRLTTGLLPAMVEQGAGHVINVSSIGVLMNAARFSAYSASKAALDAWAHTAASEYAELGIDFTTIYMPLVRTPMIAPTESYAQVPALSVEEAAELVLRGVIERPARIATSVGIALDVLRSLAPLFVRSLNAYLFRSAP